MLRDTKLEKSIFLPEQDWKTDSILTQTRSGLAGVHWIQVMSKWMSNVYKSHTSFAKWGMFCERGMTMLWTRYVSGLCQGVF